MAPDSHQPVAPADAEASGPRRWFIRWRWWLLGAVLALVAVRVALPWVLLALINSSLSAPGVVMGHVDGLSLSCLRGVGTLRGISIRDAEAPPGAEPLLRCERLQVAVSWTALLHGRLESAVEVDRPLLTYLNQSPAVKSIAQSGRDSGRKPGRRDGTGAKTGGGKDHETGTDQSPPDDWRRRLGGIIPFRIDSLVIRDGAFTYRDRQRHIEVGISRIGAELCDLIGGADPSAASAQASLRAEGVTTGSGRLSLDLHTRPWLKDPDFELRCELAELQLPALNASLKHLDGLAFRAGRLTAYIELANHGGQLEGQVKPYIQELDVSRFRDSKRGISKAFWKAVIAVGEAVLVNDDTGALAARIPVHGRIEGPQTDVWTIVATALGNAFSQALIPGFEGFGGSGVHFTH